MLVTPVTSFLVREMECPTGRWSLVDGTVGGGGHALALLRCLVLRGVPPEQVTYLGVDRDREALRRARLALSGIPARVDLVHGRLSELGAIARRAGITAAQGVLLDLGVSSLQLDEPARGFSFGGSLDMRMDPEGDPITARDLVNQLGEVELTTLLREFGEERHARRIARGILAERARQPISTGSQLAAVVARSVPPRARHSSKHVATRTFQALRIAVNDELVELRAGLEAALELLDVSGRLVVISFHSLEDRLVKQRLRQASQDGQVRILTPRVITADHEELQRNRRARSAKLRAAERQSHEVQV